jgi:hypothetical protein
MTDVTTYQHQLLAAIFDCRIQGEFDSRGLAVYRANLRATAAHTLHISFPTVNLLIGDTLFDRIAEQLLEKEPPQFGNWASWGAMMPELLREQDSLQTYPFVADCAQLDYVCHQLVRREDSAMQLETLPMMQTQAPQTLQLHLNPTLTLLASDYPIAQIRAAHQLEQTQRNAALEQASALLRTQHRFYVACYRDGYQVRVEPITAAEYRWLHLLKDHSLQDALTRMEGDYFSFQDWLMHSVQSNLLQRVSAKMTPT